MKSERAIKSKTVKLMKALGTYKPEYDPMVEIYAQLRYQYDILTERFVESDYKHEEETSDGGAKKAPILGALESLRKDILMYSDRLCLTPKAMDKVTVEKKKESKMEAALRELRVVK